MTNALPTALIRWSKSTFTISTASIIRESWYCLRQAPNRDFRKGEEPDYEPTNDNAVKAGFLLATLRDKKHFSSSAKHPWRKKKGGGVF